MTFAAARRTATAVGVATSPIGGWLVLAPEDVARALGLRDSRAVRIIGVADLALVPGLIAGRPRWPWMAARAGLNVAIAAHLLDATRKTPDRRPRAVALLLAGITVADVATARRLSIDERRDGSGRT